MTASFSQVLMADARAFVTSKFGGNDMSSVPVEAIRAAVEQLYDGGWVAYERDFRRFHNTVSVVESEPFSPVKQRAIVSAMTKRRLGDYDDIIVFDFDQNDHATFVVSRVTVIDRRARRDIVSEREITLYKFTRSPEVGWKLESVSITEPVSEIHQRFGTINTVQRERDKKDQYENCYRPGTHKSPLPGWVARLELSWDQAHADEVFPRITTT